MLQSKRELPLAARGLNWLEIAAETRRAIDKSGRGERVAVYGKIAEQHGINVHVIRRLVAGHQAYERVLNSNPEDAATLLKLPFSAAELLFRWYHLQPDAAIGAAKQYIDRSIGVREITNLERDARFRLRSQLVVDRQALQKIVKQHVRTNIPNATEYEFFDFRPGGEFEKSGMEPLFRTAGIDLLAKPLRDVGSNLAISIICSVIEDDDFGLRRRLQEQVWRSLGVAITGTRSLVVAVGNFDVQEIINSIRTFNLPDGQFELWQLDAHDFDPE